MNAPEVPLPPASEAAAGRPGGRPAWATVPNAITLLRLLLLAPVCWLLVREATLGPGSVLLLALWASTDWIDGFLARRLHQVSRVGQMLDPIADRVGIGAVVVCLAAAGHLSWWAVGIVLVTDLATALLAGRAAARGRIVVHLLGKTRTAVMFLGIALLVGALAFRPSLAIVGTVVVWVGVLLHIIAGASYIRAAATGSLTPPQVTR
ncbi:CDP-alcohol phosphatidyltransferase family protein [Raineyella fluvialis]|uniref:CDP-alcohol phosphatidyltransferase family protein n=1 Tax=Raineyella fluvialis TaxID=2662261 RepID=A0A5Q2FAV6_9ACTN|nr:CDP-alcohol phosphatidyltransferase family protein [Raineyella fluvialis]QGF24140.1 CDP-alcohol phosphatidyltransferase family protein [Raineyella fluvialis]